MKLAAAEVEDVLRTHAMVLDAAVVRVPDSERGNDVKAYVVLVADEDEHSFPPQAIVDFCAEGLAAFKVPRYIQYGREGFPRTPSMRIASLVIGTDTVGIVRVRITPPK